MLTKLNESLPLYIRCIKPNEVKKPKIFHSKAVSAQLKAAGMLEAIKIRKAGYSIRRTYEEFTKEYKNLMKLNGTNSP